MRRPMLQRLALPVLIAASGWPQAQAAGPPVITIEGMQFQPATLTVQRGEQVVWRNQDLVPHTATAMATASGGARGFDSGPMAPGSSWVWTPTAPGRYDYVCTFHPGMKATLVVR